MASSKASGNHLETGGLAVLEPGARGLAVMELKRRLRKWFEQHGELPPRRMRGPVYGTSAVEAVKRFQREAGLTANGVVGQETWRALPD
jgi:murein L,D-transpeptidase YcbB/YkuD